jgi:redox-sensitive bicupin YhaK (pirin superfamily)
MPIDIIIEPRMHDLGGFTVGRVLPYAKRRMVGPFIFFDEMGPATFKPGTGIDVRPHPHIGLATVTYLFSGEMRHRDSLGYDLNIHPGDVNWMTAGRGIVHSERTDDAARESGQHMHGMQSWIALPEDAEDTAPDFHHHPKAELPLIARDGAVMRLIAGSAFGETSPVKIFSPMFYLGVEAEGGAPIPLPDEYEERAMYIVEGGVSVDGERHESGRMLVFRSGANPDIRTTSGSKLMLLGGAPMGKRLIWWNLVSSSQDRIDRAKQNWLASAQSGFRDSVFSLPPGETEHIPLPET